ncbi:sensor domain-containing protein [Methylocystis heyeri]|nr:EAL domain-containing protein [Methylocystis heyeri]
MEALDESVGASKGAGASGAPDGSPPLDLMAMFQALPIALLLKDGSGRIICVNRACGELLGLPPDDPRAADPAGAPAQDLLGVFQGDDEEVFRGGAVVEVGCSFWCSGSAERRHGLMFKRPIYDPLGVPAFILCAIVDVTERRKVEESLRASEEKLRSLYELSPLGIALTDMEGRYVDFNGAFERICGYPREELNSLDYWTLTPREYEAEEQEHLRSLVETGCYGPYEKEYVRKDGMRVPLRLNGVLVTGSDGAPYIWSVVEDVAERKKNHDSLYLGALIFNSSSEGVLIADADENIVDVNPAFSRHLGFSREEAKGCNCSLIGLGLNEDQGTSLSEALKGQERHESETWARHKDGRRLALSATFSLIRGKDGGVFRYIMQFSDVTERRRKDETIWRQANFDPLTELPNRRLFYDRLESEISRAERAGQILAVLFIDLDRFKEANDSLGHHAGDAVLVETAQRLRRCVRSGDVVARLGGDEFTVILCELGDRSVAEHFARRINREISAPYVVDDKNIHLSASIGITVFPEDAQDAESLLKRSDLAMYQAKYEGRNRFTHFTQSLQQEADRRLTLTNDLACALERGELELFYQPIVELGSGRLAKAEALLRWRHPRRGMISPGEFIPIAEESGLILDIGDWVLNEAADVALRWAMNYEQRIQLAVNISPLQFAERTRVLQWVDRLATLHLPPGSLALEFTEGMLIRERPELQQQLSALRSIGVEMSIDDFGTGFSSLSYLKRFCIETLKIDRSFIKDIAEDATDRSLTEAIILMAKKLGIKTVAEGVETAVQLRLLEQFGCDCVQGFLFARPTPLDEFEMRFIKEAGGMLRMDPMADL